MNKFLKIILILFISFLIPFVMISFSFKKDKEESYYKAVSYEPFLKAQSIVPKYKNVTIDGTDYLQSELPIGKFKGALTSSILGDPKTFNPYNANDSTSAELSEIMYDGLTQTNPSTGEVVPKLAKSWDILPDKKTYIIHLRKGIQWSDGVEITADDVVYTYDTIIFGGFGDGATKDVLTIDKKLPKIEKIDKYTVKFTTPKPFAPFIRTLSASIVPKHVFKKATDKGNAYFLTYNGVNVKPENLVVSGAFKLKEYIPSQRVVYERNPNYYLINKKNEKLPYLDKLIMVIVGDINNQNLKFESGMLDILSIQGSIITRYRELMKNGDFYLYDMGPDTTTTFLTFNLNNRKNKEGKYYVDPKKQAWFQDKNFRSAVDWAIDRDDLVLNIYSGFAAPLHSAEAPNSIFLNKKIVKGHPKNIEYAKTLLSQSGFYLKDNILYDKNNNRVEFELLTNAGNTQREAIGVSIKEDLEKLGMKVNFKSIDFNSLTTKLTNEVNFDCIIIALTSNILEPNSGYNVWTPMASLHLFNKRTINDAKNSPPPYPFELELETLFQNGALELDYNKRKIIYDKYQELVAEYNPLIYLVSPLDITAIRKKIKNTYPTKLNGVIFNRAEIYID